MVLIDTAGLDDRGQLGQLRKKKTLEVLNKTDLAIVVIDATEGLTDFEKDIVDQIQKKNIPIVGAINKIDEIQVSTEEIRKIESQLNISCIPVSASNHVG